MLFLVVPPARSLGTIVQIRLERVEQILETRRQTCQNNLLNL